MNQQQFDNLLRPYQQRPTKTLPPNFRDGVWRAIRNRRSQNQEPSAWWNTILGNIIQARVLFGAIAVAIAFGAVLGSRWDGEVTQNTRAAVNLEVFGGAAPALPSTLLAANGR